AEEEQRALLLLVRHRAQIAARETIDRRVREDERELELGDGAPEHREVDRPARGDLGEAPREQLAIAGAAVEVLEENPADGIVAEPRGVGRRDGKAEPVVEGIE